MKKTFAHILTAVSAILVIACSKESSKTDVQQEVHNIINLTVSAEKGGDVADIDEDGATKVSYNWGDDIFTFDADDQILFLVGKKASGDSWSDQTTVRVNLKSGDGSSSATFGGTVDLGSYSISDIKGAVIVKAATPTSKYSLSYRSTTATVTFAESASQTQSQAGVFSDGTGRFFFYAPVANASGTPVSGVTVEESGADIVISGLKFGMKDCVWEYHIYGGTEFADKKVESITVNANGSSVDAQYIMASTIHKFTMSSGAHSGVDGTYNYSSTVTLDTPASIPSTAESGAVIWQTIYGGGTNTVKNIKNVTVKTEDGAYYIKEGIGTEAGMYGQNTYLLRVNLNLDNFTKLDSPEISTDGGTTWVFWQSDLPSGTNHTSLAVKSSSVSLNSSQLSDINTWIASQSGTVALDLSGIKYEATTFPQVFGNSTAANANTKLKSIKFPSNVTAIAAQAFRFCTGLTSVDFTGIKQILPASNNESRAFCNCTNLTEINLPNITKLGGQYVFQNCTKLERVTFGPNLTSYGGRIFNGCSKLTTITCQATEPPTGNGGTKDLIAYVGASVTGTIYVPSSAVTTYSAATGWKESLSSQNSHGAWTITAISE